MIQYASHDGLQIAYELMAVPAAESDRRPLLLIMGHLGQMVGWPNGFCAELSARGFQVARFDNRDAGLSGRFTDGLRQSRVGQLLRPRVAYRLDDMAGDALAVLDDLGWSAAHVVGISMGGMIAQRLAVTHSERVLSLTSMMATPSPRIGRVRRRTLLKMVTVGRQLGRPKSFDDVMRSAVAFHGITGSPGFPLDFETLSETVRESLARDPDPLGTGGGDAAARQRAAIRTSGDRRGELSRITAPVLVVHGDRDVLIRPAGGRATAAAIRTARLVRYPGMGHDLPRALWSTIADEIASTAADVGDPAPARTAAGASAAIADQAPAPGL